MIYTARSGVQNQHEYLEKAWYWGVPIVAALIIVVMLLARMWTAEPSSVGATYPDQTNKTYTVPSTNNTATTPSDTGNPPASIPTPPSNSNFSTPVVSPGPISSNNSPAGSASSTPVIGGRGGAGDANGGSTSGGSSSSGSCPCQAIGNTLEQVNGTLNSATGGVLPPLP
jgi:uncharacterized membrane protein YgcG